MNKQIQVKIIGTPVACKDGIKETWRDIAKWVEDQLISRYGDLVNIRYFDLFDPDCPPIPPESQLPVVLVDEQVVSTGGKISIPLIRKRIDELNSESLKIVHS